LATPHTVEQGEHLSSIALKHGFFNYRTVWLDSANDRLRETRKDPNVLFPGDVVMIPERTTKVVDAATTKVHSFRLAASHLKLQIRLLQFYNRPIASAPAVLAFSTSADSLTSDGDGLIVDAVAARDEKAELRVAGLRIEVRIGHLDPVETPPGQLGRLTNLGYYLGPATGEVDAAQVLSAVEEFQCDNELTVDGRCGPLTQSALEKIHGS
jgi:hypothetical protein